MPNSPQLRFVVAGAQKAGTTSLDEALRLCDVRLPFDKEAPFFSRDDQWAMGWEAFSARHYVGRAPRQAEIVGKVTPQYMCDPCAPRRIAQLFPDVRIIAILRNPIERAKSHFAMTASRGWEKRTFADAIACQLDPSALSRARAMRALPQNERDCYVAWGEYGRVINVFLDFFPPEQILLVDFHQMIRQPSFHLNRVLQHISPELQPPTAGFDLPKRNAAANSASVRLLNRMLASSPLRALTRAVPPHIRARSKFRLLEAAGRLPTRSHTDTPISNELEQALRQHYLRDLGQLPTGLRDGCVTVAESLHETSGQ